jgi:hypothetical protein
MTHGMPFIAFDQVTYFTAKKVGDGHIFMEFTRFIMFQPFWSSWLER